MTGVANEQLALVTDLGPTVEQCRCGHDEHIGPCTYGRGTRFGGCTCPRFTPLGFVPVELPKWLSKPAGAIDLIRQDLKRRKGKDFEKRKVMGWVLVGETSLIGYLSQLETVSPNVYKSAANSLRFSRITQQRHDQIMAMLSTGEATQRERAMNLIEMARVEGRARPSKCTLTRISTGKLDGDNHQGALKHIRDGIAEGLLETSDRLFDDGACALTYKQAPPGKRGIYGVLVELSWGAT